MFIQFGWLGFSESQFTIISFSYIFDIVINLALARNSSFGFYSAGFCVGKNQICCLCGWLF